MAEDAPAAEPAHLADASARPGLSLPSVPSLTPAPSQSRPRLTVLGRRSPGAAVEGLRISVLESHGPYDRYGSRASGDFRDADGSGRSRGFVKPRHQQLSVPPWLTDSGDAETLHVAQHVHGSAAVTHGGAEVFLEPGDIVFCGPGTLASPRPGDAYRMTVFHVPRHLLTITDTDLRRVLGVPLRCAEGVGALVSHSLSVLAEVRETHHSRPGERLVADAVEILAALVVDAVGTERPDSPDPGTRMAAAIRNHIDLHLTDPDLSPRSIARAHHISVRYLHKLFEDEGTTVSRLIRRRRLEACRRELGRTPRRRLTVAAVAHRWGFVSPSHFSRAFRDAYGMSPSQWQSSASAAQQPVFPGRTQASAGNRSRPAEGQRVLSA
ncbi:helix-turn-helix domain-containing protein [Streptomyces sp. NPDC008125]|uniref:helix-turn-helix domain-containing protein n=1 Tax=Streptomyces sp. NPDC008125 TaxID=3364811 RepID=UPI0036E9639A